MNQIPQCLKRQLVARATRACQLVVLIRVRPLNGNPHVQVSKARQLLSEFRITQRHAIRLQDIDKLTLFDEIEQLHQMLATDSAL